MGVGGSFKLDVLGSMTDNTVSAITTDEAAEDLLASRKSQDGLDVLFGNHRLTGAVWILQHGPDSILVLGYVLGSHSDGSFNRLPVSREAIVEKSFRVGLGDDDGKREIGIRCAKVLDFKTSNKLSVADHGQAFEWLPMRQEPLGVSESVQQLQGSGLNCKRSALVRSCRGLVDDAE